MRWCLVLLVLMLSFPSSTFAGDKAEDSGEALLEAVQRQEVARVRELLEAGADANSRSPYGATPLFFAADKGDLQLVRLLLEHGAEVDVTDTFYSASPLAWSLSKAEDSKPHREIALLLLEKVSGEAAQVLAFGAREGDLALVRAAVAKEEASAQDLKDALSQARSRGHLEVSKFLEGKVAALPAADEPPSTVPASVLASYEGKYLNGDTGMVLRVFVAEEGLWVQAEGQDPLSLRPEGEAAFAAREAPGVSLRFSPEKGIPKNLFLRQGDNELSFARSLPEAATKPDGAEEKEEAVELASLKPAKRGAVRPWPSFRGENASGVGDGQGVVFSWDGEAGRHVRWRTPIPGIALSSPVIWGDHIFVTAAISEGQDSTFRTGLYGDVDSVNDDSVHKWKVFALDKATGKILWQRVASEGQPQVKRHLKSSHANPTPVTDGEHLVVSFGSEGLFCYDFAGKLLWRRELGRLGSGWFFDPTYEWGFSSSPILHRGKVIVQVDIQKASFLAAFDVASGKELWRTPREEIPSWGSPSILPAAVPGGVDEVITNAPTVRGYDAATGRELWTLTPNSEITVATPVVADGVAYITGGYAPARPIYAIKPGGRGDLTLAEGSTSNASILWSVARGGTYIPTPIAYRGILYLLQNNGRLTAYDSKTGELHFRARVGRGESFSGSPVAADGFLFLTTEDGRTYVVRAGKTYELAGTNELGDVVMTTPAISDGLMVIRGMRHLYGIGEMKREAEGDLN